MPTFGQRESDRSPRERSPRRITAVGVGDWSARHGRLVMLAWVAALIAVAVGHRALHTSYSSTLEIPGSRAQAGTDLLRAHDSRAGDQNGQIVFVAASGVRSHAPAIQAARANVAKLPDVVSVSNPLGHATVSADGRVAYASVTFSTDPQSLGRSYVRSVETAVGPARSTGVAVDYGGALGQAAAPRGGDARSELIGIVVALAVLLIGFGSVLATLLPLISAVVGVIAAVSAIGMLAAAISFGTDAPTLGTMMGLGVGIDYALFLTTRHRQLLMDGDDTPTAIRRTMAASGHSVAVAATTVIIAMLGLYASGISYIGKLGLAAAVAVAIAALAGLTLVPALLGAARERIDRLHVRRPIAEPGDPRSPLRRYIRAIGGRPLPFALGGVAILLVLAVPALSMRLGHVGAGDEPHSVSERRAYDAITQGFGPGANGPLTIVVAPRAGTSASRAGALARALRTRLASVDDVRSVSAFAPSRDGALLVGRVTPTTGPQSTTTTALVERLQDTVLPQTIAATHVAADADVSGATAENVDFAQTVSRRLAIVIAVVVAAAFVLLLASFRSPLIAITAAVLNVLSIAAAYGILVAAFQWGWISGALGIAGHVPIESYVPMIVFAIVFGLSMDYEVFLISRIRESWLAGHATHEAVGDGVARTARVITCAALILACVFFAFLLSPNPSIKMLALGLGVAVILDATVIRLMLVPALMMLFGRANWWAPRWLAGPGRQHHEHARAAVALQYRRSD